MPDSSILTVHQIPHQQVLERLRTLEGRKFSVRFAPAYLKIVNVDFRRVDISNTIIESGPATLVRCDVNTSTPLTGEPFIYEEEIGQTAKLVMLLMATDDIMRYTPNLSIENCDKITATLISSNINPTPSNDYLVRCYNYQVELVLKKGIHHEWNIYD